MKWIVTIVFLFCASSFLLSQTTLVGWDFEDSNTTADYGTDGSGNSPNNLSQTISANAGATTFWDSGTPGIAFSTNSWASGDFLVFTVNTTNFTDLAVSFDIRASTNNQGPRDFKLAYSVNGSGGPFTDGPSFTVTTSYSSKSFSLPTDLEQEGNVAIRLQCTSNTSTNGGTINANAGRLLIDNIEVTSSLDDPLPVELSSFSAIAGDGHVTLHWATESEINNLQFDILRAPEQQGDYVLIGSREGQFNTNQRTEYTFTDDNVANGTTYWYKLEDVDINGVRTEHGPISATPGLPEDVVADQFKLLQNYPNPFNPVTTLQVYVPGNAGATSSVNVEIYNLLGQKVKTLFEGNLPAGLHPLTWRGDSDRGAAVPGGIYFAVLRAGAFQDHLKLALLK